MKSRQVGFVLMALILIGIIGMGLKLISSDGDDFVMAVSYTHLTLPTILLV